MFEQSVLINHPANKNWSVLVSLSLQTLLVAVAMAIPLVFTDHLPQVHWLQVIGAPLPPAPPSPPQEEPLVGRNSAPQTPQTSRTFVAPRHIPDTVPQIVDEPGPPMTSPASTGVQGGTGSERSIAALVDKLIEKPATVPPQPAKPAEPLPVGGQVQAAKLIRQVIPQYPELAKRARVSGTVRLVGIIGKDGTIENLQLIAGPPLLVRAAMDAVKQWIYKPTLLNTVPVEVIAPIDVVFTLCQ
jgi:periplasmic protein TonB